MNFEQEFLNKFGEKYSNLYLKSVVVSQRENLCTITFLYPSTLENLSDEEKEEIASFIKEKLNLSSFSVKVKFLKAYVEEKLIKKTISQIFEDKFKLLSTYVKDEDIAIKISNIDVEIVLKVSPRIYDFIQTNKVANYLAKELKNNYLIEFVITLEVLDDKIDEVDIENFEVKVTKRKTLRYDVLFIKNIVKFNNLENSSISKPEFLSQITGPKKAVIVAGYIHNLARKDFVIKKGARAGQQKAYFTFTLEDRQGKIDAIYFCPHTYEKDLEALEENMFLLLHGDVRIGLSNKPTLYVDKIALASEVENSYVEEKNENEKDVEIEKLNALEQDNMFGKVSKYNNKILSHKIVVFDIETTGLNTDLDQIIELGAVKIEGGNIIEKFSTFVKPTIEIPYEVTEITHITNEMVADAPSIETVIKKFYEFSRDSVLCGHNIINFDIKFIKRFGSYFDLDFDNDIIDTMNEARNSKLKISRFNLGTVTKALGIQLVGAHRAWNDAFATAQVLLKLNQIAK